MKFISKKPIDISDGAWHSTALGDLLLYISRKGEEYNIAKEYQSPHLASLCKPLSVIGGLPEGTQVEERFYLQSDSDIPVFSLQLADKPYQVKPAALVKIAPHSRLVLYVSTPLWLQVRSPSCGEVLAEYPAVRPRMSWVGSNTIEGSLCYSSQTSAPSNLSEVRHTKHRALTALELVNDGNKVLVIDRLSLPLNILSLYICNKNEYWTESVRYRVNPDTGETTIVASQKPPEQLGEALQISEARSQNRASRFRTAMSLIMG